MSGYGESGPYVDRPGQDLLLQGMSGAMLSAGRAGEPPTPAGQYLADAVTAYTAFEGALAALLHRERTGEGQLVQVNMLDAIVAIQMQELSVFTVGNKPQVRSAEPHAHSYIRAPYGVFANGRRLHGHGLRQPEETGRADRRAELCGNGRRRDGCLDLSRRDLRPHRARL